LKDKPLEKKFRKYYYLPVEVWDCQLQTSSNHIGLWHSFGKPVEGGIIIGLPARWLPVLSVNNPIIYLRVDKIENGVVYTSGLNLEEKDKPKEVRLFADWNSLTDKYKEEVIECFFYYHPEKEKLTITQFDNLDEKYLFTKKDVNSQIRLKNRGAIS
jgi:hypothetical protein